MLLKKGKDDVRAIVFSRFRIERDTPEALTIETAPPAVGPGADYQSGISSRIVLEHGPISPKRPGKVLRIEPSTHHQYSTLDVFHVARKIARLPVAIVGGVADLVAPEEVLALEIEFVGVGQRPHLEEEVIEHHESPQSEQLPSPRGKTGLGPGFEEVIDAEIGLQHECAAMIGIVAHEQIGHGRFRRSRFERRVRINDAR